MGDLYHIPGDDGKTYRLKKFVEYQHEVPSTHYRFVGRYLERHGCDKDQIVDAAFLLSSTYSEITTVFLYELLKNLSPEDIWKYKKELNVGSARKYVKNNDEFVPLMRRWREMTADGPYMFVKSAEGRTPKETYRNIHSKVRRISGVGRFAADTFMETIVFKKGLLELDVEEPGEIDWKNSANLTSGILNIFYEDENANLFDRKKTLTDDEKMRLTQYLSVIRTAIQAQYPEQNSEISMFIGKICSFRNLFKNARYGGFHHDRQLGVLRQYEERFPEYGHIWSECYEIRREIFPDRFLGELHGWGGIRPWRKKLWTTAGLTGVEPESLYL